jgi:hypothetical protein
MSKVLLKALLISPAALGAALVVSTSAVAAEVAVSTDPAQSTDATSLQHTGLEITANAETISSATLNPTSVAPVEIAQTAIQSSPVQIAQVPVEQPGATPDASNLEQINRYSREGRSANQAGQVTSVSQLSDVRPTDWAFQALQSLVERYGCIVGYPDKTYRGNQAMTRYEFAAGLNACMDRVNELIAAATTDLVRKEDLAVLQKLQEEFAAELATLRGRVDALEARTSTLEKQQFSTTTKLAGEVIFAITDEVGQPIDNEIVFQNRVRLELNTSFTGKDRLVTRIAAGNAGFFNTETEGPEGFQTFNIGNTEDNSVFIDWVAYFFQLGENVEFYVPAVSGLHYDYAPTSSGLMEAFDGGNGPLSFFAQRNPIYSIGGGSGAGVNINVGQIGVVPPLKVSLGYLADNSDPTDGDDFSFAANIPSPKNGLFNGSYSALGQLTFSPSEAFSISATYVHAYRRFAIFDAGAGIPATGTIFANSFDGLKVDTPATVNAYGISGAYKFNQTFSVNAFGAFIDADDIGDGADAADIWTFGVGVAVADLGKKGNLLGLMAGVEPYVSNPEDSGFGDLEDDWPIHLEAFYKYQLNDNISITPGIIWILNPGQDSDNSDTIIGTIRTTFTF